MGSGTAEYSLEIEPEIRDWLAGLRPDLYEKVEAHADYLAENAETIRMPRSRPLEGKVHELRFGLDRKNVRITYWLAPDRRIVMLTVFHKTRDHEAAQIERALKAQKRCEAGHEKADTVWTR